MCTTRHRQVNFLKLVVRPCSNIHKTDTSEKGARDRMHDILLNIDGCYFIAFIIWCIKVLRYILLSDNFCCVEMNCITVLIILRAKAYSCIFVRLYEKSFVCWLRTLLIKSLLILDDVPEFLFRNSVLALILLNIIRASRLLAFESCHLYFAIISSMYLKFPCRERFNHIS